jgi:phosphopantothenoylcysteine decarboxylase/phosphopantothenate--cysteine ligase
VSLETPPHVQRVNVVSASDMLDAVLARVGGCDIFIAVAAVADYRPVVVAPNKLKKEAGQMTLTLTRNPDILATVTALANAPFTVGFAAETEQLEVNAQAKRAAKSLDMIAANRVGEGMAFGTDDNALQVFWDGGSQLLAETGKAKLARQLVALVAQRFHGKHNKVIRFNAKDSA